MRVTVCQLDPRPGALDEGIQALATYLESNESDFLLLPEMCFSPWLAADRTPRSDRWLGAVEQHNQYIGKLDTLQVPWIMGTRPVVTATGSRRNHAYLWSSRTKDATSVHEKYYLPDEEGYWENTWYDRGDGSFDVARAEDIVIGVQICTEMWFYEWARHYARSRVDLLCIPRATPHSSVDKWLAGGRTSAVCSGSYSLSSNLWCPPGENADCGGLSWIIDPEGEVLATTDRNNPFATAEVNLEFASASKRTYPRYVAE